MKENTDWNQLIQKHLAGMASEEETARLEHTLESDPDLRRLYLDYSNLDMALEASAEAAKALQEAQVLPKAAPNGNFSSLWFSWRPLSSAVAGIVLGGLSTTMLWAYTSPKIPEVLRIVIPLEDPGFEETSTPLPFTPPRTLNSWNGDASHITVPAAEVAVQPQKKSQYVLKMQPVSERDFSRLEQIVPVGHLVPAEGGSVDFSADFFCDSALHACKALLVVRAFSLRGDEIEGTTRDLRDEVTSTARKAVILSPGMTSWRRGKVRMDLPPDTKTLVFSMVATDPPMGAPNASQYIDNVKAVIVATNPGEN